MELTHQQKQDKAQIKKLWSKYLLSYPYPLLHRLLAEIIYKTDHSNSKRSAEDRMNAAMKAIFGEPYALVEDGDLIKKFEHDFKLYYLHGIYDGKDNDVLLEKCRIVIEYFDFTEKNRDEMSEDELSTLNKDARALADKYTNHKERIERTFLEEGLSEYFDIHFENLYRFNEKLMSEDDKVSFYDQSFKKLEIWLKENIGQIRNFIKH